MLGVAEESTPAFSLAIVCTTALVDAIRQSEYAIPQAKGGSWRSTRLVGVGVVDIDRVLGLIILVLGAGRFNINRLVGLGLIILDLFGAVAAELGLLRALCFRR